jgi:LacI family transcriptional regulator
MLLQPTIKDVAKEAGVSIGTVDRVLHNRGRVSDLNIKTVLAAVEKLQYSPSQIARALVNRKNNLRIGITYPKVDNDFWSEIPNGIELARNKLLPFGVELLVEYTETYDVRDQIVSIDRLIAKDIDGLLFTSVEYSSAEQIECHIPENVPYATVVNPVAPVSRCAFHIGPDDFILGNLAARLVSLFCGETCNLVLLAPNYNHNGTQQRIAGVLSKLNQNLPGINLLKVFPISGFTDEDIRNNVYNAAVHAIKMFPYLNAIYVSDGFFDLAALAVRDEHLGGKVKVFGHEYTSTLPELISQDFVSATIYQKPAEQWYQAVMMLTDLLCGNLTVPVQDTRIECSIIIKETLSLIKIGSINLS